MMDVILSISPFQWFILLVLILLLVFDIEKRRECVQDAQMAREGKDPAEILVANTLVRMNWCDIVGVGFFIGWIVLRHEAIPPDGPVYETMGLASFSIGVSLVLVKRWYERELRNELRALNNR